MNIPQGANIATLLQPGTNLFGQVYTIVDYLSSGGFGNTYIAEDHQRQELVVIKELFVRGINERLLPSNSVKVSNADNIRVFDELFNRFRSEAQRQSLINDHHVVKVYRYFEQNNTAYLVMQYVKGDSLHQRVKKSHVLLTTPQAWKLMDQMLRALAAIHKKRLYHLDIKPANIMIDLNGDVKLIDFGASKQQNFSESTSISLATTVMCYTPGYAPSEQEQRIWKKIGPWTDLYALGGTLYTCLTGKNPPKTGEIIDSHERAFDFSNVDPLLANVILWLMQPSKNDRPANVNVLRNYLLKAGVINMEGFYPPEASLLPVARVAAVNENDKVIDIDDPSLPSRKKPEKVIAPPLPPAKPADEPEPYAEEISERVVLIGGNQKRTEPKPEPKPEPEPVKEKKPAPMGKAKQIDMIGSLAANIHNKQQKQQKANPVPKPPVTPEQPEEISQPIVDAIDEQQATTSSDLGSIPTVMPPKPTAKSANKERAGLNDSVPAQPNATIMPPKAPAKPTVEPTAQPEHYGRAKQQQPYGFAAQQQQRPVSSRQQPVMRQPRPVKRNHPAPKQKKPMALWKLLTICMSLAMVTCLAALIGIKQLSNSSSSNYEASEASVEASTSAATSDTIVAPAAGQGAENKSHWRNKR